MQISRKMRALRECVADIEATGDEVLAGQAASVLDTLLHAADRVDEDGDWFEVHRVNESSLKKVGVALFQVARVASRPRSVSGATALI